MSDRFYSDWGSLTRAAKRAAVNILQSDVAPIAQKILLKHIATDIYGAYTPRENAWVGGTTYQRRHVLEGNLTSIMIEEDTLLTTSTATASPSVVVGYHFENRYPGSLLELIESGHTGIWRGGFPRPAVANAEREINNSADVNRAIRNGIKREITG